MTARPTLDGCVCGDCRYCPDGWHGDQEACGCTPGCILGDDPCPACGYHSVTDGICRACGVPVGSLTG